MAAYHRNPCGFLFWFEYSTDCSDPCPGMLTIRKGHFRAHSSPFNCFFDHFRPQNPFRPVFHAELAAKEDKISWTFPPDEQLSIRKTPLSVSFRDLVCQNTRKFRTFPVFETIPNSFLMDLRRFIMISSCMKSVFHPPCQQLMSVHCRTFNRMMLPLPDQSRFDVQEPDHAPWGLIQLPSHWSSWCWLPACYYFASWQCSFELPDGGSIVSGFLNRFFRSILTKIITSI